MKQRRLGDDFRSHGAPDVLGLNPKYVLICIVQLINATLIFVHE